ncbi:hypothetical protein MED297_01960 [Reinekea sp. MED297]|uniref:Uncharacterized protein n=1 Tax=Reinekea blandensis MED297 TaxID=314283 RepID=A4BJF3_9GAMM|nr:hypothetical protein MED297_01960 [Reinekea sp. MED297] [Reinekea blandensis MED297]
MNHIQTIYRAQGINLAHRKAPNGYPFEEGLRKEKGLVTRCKACDDSRMSPQAFVYFSKALG